MSNMESQLVDLLSRAKRIACLTGAGISTDSGIPDFRSSRGLYETITSEDIFGLSTFERSPEYFYQTIGPVYRSILNAVPNAGHKALADLEKLGKQVEIATQNIDFLHQKAGSSMVYEVHGTMKTLTCLKCWQQVEGSDYQEELLSGRVLRHQCGGVLKPDITFFGEALPEDALSQADEAMRGADLILILGTSLVVYPAAALPSSRRPGTPVVIINQTETRADNEATLVFHQSISEVLFRAVAAMSHAKQ